MSIRRDRNDQLKCVEFLKIISARVNAGLGGATLRKLDSHFLSNRMGYDRGDSFPFDFESNEIPFGSKSKGKLSPRSYSIQCERKWKYSFLSVSKPQLETTRRQNN